MNKVSVVLIDGLRLVRQALRLLIEAEPSIQILADTGNGTEAVGLAEGLRPDVLLTDLALPGLNGFDVIREVNRKAPRTGILALSARCDKELALRSLSCGATGFVCKTAESTEFITAIRDVAAGSRYLYPPIHERDVEGYLQRSGDSPQDPYDTLSLREREVLQLAAEGHTNAGIAIRLSISPRTVEAHRLRAMHKLDLRSTTDLVRFAIRRGILSD